MAKTTRGSGTRRPSKEVGPSDGEWTAEAKRAKRAADKRAALRPARLARSLGASADALWQTVRGDRKFLDRLTRAREDTVCREELDRFLAATASPALPEHLDESVAAATLVMGLFCADLPAFWLKARGIAFMLNVAEVIGRRGLSEKCDGRRCWIVENRPDLRHSAFRWVEDLGAYLDTGADVEDARRTVRTLGAGLRERAPAAVRWALSTIAREPAWIDSDVDEALRAPGPFPLPTLAHAGNLERAAQLLRASPNGRDVEEDLAPLSLDLLARRGAACTELLGEIARQAAAALRDPEVPHDTYSWPVPLGRWEPLLHAICLAGGGVAIEAVVELLSAIGDTHLTKDAARIRGIAVVALWSHAALALPRVERRAAESWTAPILERLRRAASA
jgi:hypothetical protein